MPAKKNTPLSGASRTLLRAVLDRLIPPVGDLPGAGELGLALKMEKRSAGAPRMRSALVAVLDALSLDPASHAAGGFAALSPESQDDAIGQVENALPDQFATFLALAYAVYYMAPEVRARVGWESRPPQAEGHDAAPFDESVLDKVKQRAPFWRKA